MAGPKHDMGRVVERPVLVQQPSGRFKLLKQGDLGKRLPGRRSLQEILVSVRDLPLRRGRAGDARQGQRGCEHMLAKARAWVLGIEKIDQECIVRSISARR